MDHPRRRGWAVPRHLAVPALALAVVATLPMTRSGDAPATAAAYAPGMAPASVTYAQPASPGVKGQFLSYNDFHGAIDPPTGSGAAVNGTPAGGVEYLATWLKKLRAEADAEGRKTLTVGAGDLIGASPLVSAAFHDEPTIELMNEIGLQVSSVGNHEFDEGVAELLRLQGGGCHPTDGCQDGDPYRGADFQYLAANTISKKTGLPILPPIDVKFIKGVPVGFVGLTLEGTPASSTRPASRTCASPTRSRRPTSGAGCCGCSASRRRSCSYTRVAPRPAPHPACPTAPASTARSCRSWPA